MGLNGERTNRTENLSINSDEGFVVVRFVYYYCPKWVVSITDYFLS